MDWEKFRAETAAQVLCIELGPGWGSMPKEKAVRQAGKSNITLISNQILNNHERKNTAAKYK